MAKSNHIVLGTNLWPAEYNRSRGSTRRRRFAILSVASLLLSSCAGAHRARRLHLELLALFRVLREEDIRMRIFLRAGRVFLRYAPPPIPPKQTVILLNGDSFDFSR